MHSGNFISYTVFLRLRDLKKSTVDIKKRNLADWEKRGDDSNVKKEKQMKKAIVSVLIMALAVFSVFAGGSKESQAVAADSGVTQVTFVFADGDAGAKQSINEIVNRFNAAHDDMRVVIQPGNGGNYSEFVRTRDSVGEFPDIVEMRGEAAMYIRAGKLAPLPAELTDLFLSPMVIDGNIYTVALAGENTTGVIYNKTYFDEHGLTEPKTYAEFIELCQTIQDLGDMAPLVVGGGDLWHMGFLFNMCWDDMVISQDPDFIAHCYDGSKNFSDPTVKAVFEEMQEIMQYAQTGWASTPDAQITTFIVNDMAAMMYSGTHMFTQILSADPDFELGWFPIYSHDGKLRLVGGSGISGLAVSTECQADPEKWEVAIEFLKFFYAPENYAIYCNTLSAIPVTKATPVIEGVDVLQEVIAATGEAANLSPMWNSKSGINELPPDFRNFTYKTLTEVLLGQRTIDSATEEMNKTWQVAASSFNPVTGVGIE